MQRFAFIALTILGLSTALAACGEEGNQELTFTLIKNNDSGSLFDAPETADSGLAEITLVNEGNRDSELQLIRVEGEHSLGAVRKAFEKTRLGLPLPDWFFAGGGVGLTPAGKHRTVTEALEPGTYYAINTKENQGPSPEAVAVMEVTGEASEDAIEADAAISAFEYGYRTERLPSGGTEVLFENNGAQAHDIVIAPLIGGATAADVERHLQSEEGPAPPYEIAGLRTTAVVEGGDEQLVRFNLKPGRYVLFCLVSDRKGGRPHALRGMVGEVEVR